MPKVAKQILEGAEKEASEIHAKAEAEARGIEKAREEQAKKKADFILREADGKALELKKQMLAEARLSVKQAEVEQKAGLIAKIFDAAVTRLSRVRLAEVLPKKLASNPPPNSRLLVAKRDLAWSKKNFSGESLEAGIRGGYILESGGVIRNNSFEAALESLKDEYSSKAFRGIKSQKSEKHGKK